jgi:hypothetical protein
MVAETSGGRPQMARGLYRDYGGNQWRKSTAEVKGGGPIPLPRLANLSSPAWGRERVGRRGGGWESRPAPALAHDFLAAPELSEELLHRSRKRRLVEPVDDVLALPLVDDQLGLFQDRQVP